jgi:hypothetical protein
LHGNNQQEIALSPLAFLSSSPFKKTDTFGGSAGGGSTRPNARSDRQIIAFGVECDSDDFALHVLRLQECVLYGSDSWPWRLCWYPLDYTIDYSAFSGMVDIVDIYINLNIDNIYPFHRYLIKVAKVGIFFLKMDTFDLTFHDYQSRQSEKSENDFVMCLSPLSRFYPIRKTARTVLLGHCDLVLLGRTRYARVKE